MSKVWLVNRGNHPTYNRAKAFGELHILTEGRVNIFALDNIVNQITSSLEGKTSKDDLILVSGYNVLNAITIHYFLKRYEVAKLLIWEGNNNRYTALTLNDF